MPIEVIDAVPCKISNASATEKRESQEVGALATCLAYNYRSKRTCTQVKMDGHPWCAHHIDRQGKLYKVYKTLTDHFASYGAVDLDTGRPSDPTIRVCVDIFTIALANNMDLLRKWHRSNLRKWQYGYRALEARRWHHIQFHNGGDEGHQRYMSTLKRELGLLELAMDACDKRAYKLLLEKEKASWMMESDDDQQADEPSAEELNDLDAQGPPVPRSSCTSSHSHAPAPVPASPEPKLFSIEDESDDEDRPDPYATRRSNLLRRLLNRYPDHPLSPFFVPPTTRANTCECSCWCSELALVLDSVFRRIIARSPSLYVRAKSAVNPKTRKEFESIVDWLKYEGEGELITGDLEKLWRKIRFPGEKNSFGVEFLRNAIVDGLYRDHEVDGQNEGGNADRIWVIGGWVYRKPNTDAMCERGWDLLHKFVSCPSCAESVCRTVQEVTELRMNMLIAHYRVDDSAPPSATLPSAFDGASEDDNHKKGPESRGNSPPSPSSSSDMGDEPPSDSDGVPKSTPPSTPPTPPKKSTKWNVQSSSSTSLSASLSKSPDLSIEPANTKAAPSPSEPHEPEPHGPNRHWIPYERWTLYDEPDYQHVLRVLKVLPCQSYAAPKGKIESFPIKSMASSAWRRGRGKVGTVYSETQGRHWIYVKIALDNPHGQAMVDALIDDPNETYTVYARNGSTLQTYYDPVGSSTSSEVQAPPTPPADPYAHTLWYERVRSSNSPLGRRDVSWTPKAYWNGTALEQLRDMGKFPALRDTTKPDSKLKPGQDRKGMKEVWEVLIMDNWFELDLGAEERESGYGKNERTYEEFVKGVVKCFVMACGYNCEGGDWTPVLEMAKADARRMNIEMEARALIAEKEEAEAKAAAEALADELGI